MMFLSARIAEHDIGLALESPQIRSRDLTVTNKLFQYLEAGLAVVATKTAGQIEVLQQFPGAGILVPSGDAMALANAINDWVGDREKLHASQRSAKQAGQQIPWSTQAEKLVAQVVISLGETKLAKTYD